MKLISIEGTNQWKLELNHCELLELVVGNPKFRTVLHKWLGKENIMPKKGVDCWKNG